MSVAETCWGIYRELEHSPGRVEDDAAIMGAVGEALGARGFTVELIPPEAAGAAVNAPGAKIFAMCERTGILDRLDVAAEDGATIVNRPRAVRRTRRHHMIECFARHGVPSPPSRVVPTDPTQPFPAAAVWIKRSGVHATQSDDVVYAATAAEWRDALERFAARGIPSAVVQRHVPGEPIKFYGVHSCRAGVSGAGWFEWFRHEGNEAEGPTVDTARLHATAFRAAAALELDIFGGDAILQPNGNAVIVDLNAWPSFARCRARAAQAIADHLAGCFQRPTARSRCVEPINQ